MVVLRRVSNARHLLPIRHADQQLTRSGVQVADELLELPFTGVLTTNERHAVRVDLDGPNVDGGHLFLLDGNGTTDPNLLPADLDFPQPGYCVW